MQESVADHYLSKQKGDLDWIRNGIRAVNVSTSDMQPKPAVIDRSVYDLALQYWVNHQRDYFQMTSSHDHSMTAWKERLVLRLFVFGLMSSIILAIVVLLHVFEQNTKARAVLLMVAVLAPVGAGLWEGFVDKMAFADQAKQYHRMHGVFARASKRLTTYLERNSYLEANDIIRELGREALAENADWVVLHRSRPVELPKGS